MSRTGVEPKPAWKALPEPVRRLTEDVLGARVDRGARVWGGYTPTPTFRLRLADGRGAFFKAVGPTSNAFSRAAHDREERVYRDLTDLVAPWAPAFLGAFHDDAWKVILLEDLGPKSAPPWTGSLARNVARGFGDFHQATLGMALPEWLPRPERQFSGIASTWKRHVDAEDLPSVADLAGGQAADALKWLESAAPILARVSRNLANADPPFAFLHRDARSDNLRWLAGRLRLFDWPHVGVGPAEFDAAAFAQSVAAEDGPEPEQIMAWYAERAPVRPEVLDAAVAALAGYFAMHAGQPDIPDLPRLRGFQRRQLRVTLGWAARRLGLHPPVWLGSMG